MVQYNDLYDVMGAENHLKNESNLKKRIKMSKMVIIVITAMFSANIINAQTELNTQQAVILENIKTFEEAIKPLLGKKIYIDIWTTSCAPCIMEFKHNEALKKILAENDVQQLYISLDSDMKDELWRNDIKSYNLTGTHIRANEKFAFPLIDLIYGTIDSLSIPRYVLVDEKGNIMNKRAKRPSQLVAGEKLF